MLREKVLQLMKEIEHVQKDGKIQTRGGSFSVLTEAKLLSVIRPKMIELGILVIPTQVRELVRQVSATEKSQAITGAIFQFTVIDVEDDSRWIIEAPGQGADYGDKGAGMAQTYAYKNALRKMLMLIAGDDPDMVSGEQQAPQVSDKVLNLIARAESLLKEEKITATELAWLKNKADLLDSDPEKFKLAEDHLNSRAE